MRSFASRFGTTLLLAGLLLTLTPMAATASVSWSEDTLDGIDFPADFLDYHPRTDGRYVVWASETGNASYDTEIYRWDSVDRGTWNLTIEDDDQFDPDISGGMIVYVDRDSGSGRRTLRWYDSATNVEGELTGGPFHQNYPSIDGDIVVFEGDEGGGIHDLYVVDLSATVPAAVNITNTPGSSETYPSVEGNRVVFHTTEDGGDVFSCNLDGSNRVKRSLDNVMNPIFEGSSEMANIDGGIAVWQTWNALGDTDYEVYYYDFNRGFGGRLTENADGDNYPRIGDGTVAWIAGGGGIAGCVRTYEFASDTYSWISPGSMWMNNPPWSTIDVAGGRLAWNDARSSRVDVRTAKRRCVAERIPSSSTDRFGTAAAMARTSHEDENGEWHSVNTAIVASGDDRAAADPLAAAGLCWAYDAPLLLTSAKYTPQSTLAVLADIKHDNPALEVIVVGGATSVPQARVSELEAAVGVGKVKRLLATGSRYDMAVKISQTMRTQRPAEVGPQILFANGADPDKFFDALALSAISRGRGAPILLVSKDKVPAQTAQEADLLVSTILANQAVPAFKIIGGGPNTVSEAVRAQLGVSPSWRWYGQNRYATARVIAEKAIAAYWAKPAYVAIAAKVPDALAGGAMIGRNGGVLLVTKGDSLSTDTSYSLFQNRWKALDCYVLGGPMSVTAGTFNAVQAQLNK